MESVVATEDRSLAAVFVGAGQPLELRAFPVPAPSAGEAVVRITCCTLCGSDLHTLSGHRHEATPSILGHENVGFVHAVGTPPLCDVAGRPLQPGDRVTWSVVVACGTCDRCCRGLPQKCRSLQKYGHTLATGRYALSGGLAEYLLLQAGSAVVSLDATIPDEVLCPANCATATVAAAFRTAGDVSGRRVLIFGAGMLGLTAAAFARSAGAGAVVVCDVSPERLARAMDFGADATVMAGDAFDLFRDRLQEAANETAFDVILELCGAPRAVEAACRLADVGAQVVLVGTVMSSPPVPLDPEQIVRRCLSIHGVHNYTPDDLLTAVAFLERSHDQYPFGQLVEQTFSLGAVNLAVDTARENRAIRVAVRPGKGVDDVNRQ